MVQLSVIIPVYNAEAYIGKCLDSILTQTFQDYEIICINDGSTDNSQTLLEKYANKDKRIKIIAQENKGLVSARKTGLSMACGNYATFVDADDWLEYDMYEAMMEQLLKQDADVITSGCILEYLSGSITEIEQIDEGIYDGERLPEVFYPNMIGIKEFFLQNVSLHVWNKIYRTDLVRRNVYMVPDEVTIGEDAACVYPILLEAKKIVVMHRAFYHYRMTESSMMGRNEKYAESYKGVYRYLKKRFMQYAYPYLDEQLKLLTVYELLLSSPQGFWEKWRGPFPYCGIEKGSRVVLYGLGRFGKLLKQQLEESGWCQIIALIDQNRKIDSMGIKCYSLEEFLSVDLEYDNIIISVLKRNICKGVVETMIIAGIPVEKIKEPDRMAIEKFEFEDGVQIGKNNNGEKL